MQTDRYQTTEQMIDEALELLAERRQQVKPQKLTEFKQVIAVGTEQIAHFLLAHFVPLFLALTLIENDVWILFKSRGVED